MCTSLSFFLQKIVEDIVNARKEMVKQSSSLGLETAPSPIALQVQELKFAKYNLQIARATTA